MAATAPEGGPDGQGFPGCNSYAYSCKPRESAAQCSFDNPKAVAHLGDVLGIAEGGGLAERAEVRSSRYGAISLGDFNARVEEARWVAQSPCCARLKPRPEAKALATFDDGSPAAIEHAFGKGRAVTFALDLGLIANNLTSPAIYQWWSDLMTSLGCRKAVDTGNWHVEGGMWRDDSGNRLVILINHDEGAAQSARLPDGKTIRIEPGQTRTTVLRQ